MYKQCFISTNFSDRDPFHPFIEFIADKGKPDFLDPSWLFRVTMRREMGHHFRGIDVSDSVAGMVKG